MKKEMELLILVACEESQEVCKAFRAKGHYVWSCDLKPCSGGHPDWHFVADVRDVVNGGVFYTESGLLVSIVTWDRIFFFPDCKNLCWSGERWFTEGKKPIELREQAFEFFKWCLEFPCDGFVENSLSLFLERSGYPPTQKIHPFHFGSPYRKTTCLWLKGLKPLIPTDITFRREPMVHNMWPSNDRARLRAKTDSKIAKAMAEQWG
jgi:hypothetical protein